MRYCMIYKFVQYSTFDNIFKCAVFGVRSKYMIVMRDGLFAIAN